MGASSRLPMEELEGLVDILKATGSLGNWASYSVPLCDTIRAVKGNRA